MLEYNNQNINNGKILLFLYGGYHSNCNITESMLKNIEKKRSDIIVIKVNTAKYYRLKERFNISSLPALIYLKNGNVIFKRMGSLNQKVIMNLIEGSD